MLRHRLFLGIAATTLLALSASAGLLAQSAATRDTAKSDEPPLVARGLARLTLPGAAVIIEAAQAKAREMNLKVNVAVVDDGGHLIAFARMDGGRPASIYTAITKATASATLRQPTGTLPAGGEPDVQLNLSLEHTAAASGGKITTLFGGVPVEVDRQVIGAVGVGGGTGKQDAEIARAGIARLLAELDAQPAKAE